MSRSLLLSVYDGQVRRPPSAIAAFVEDGPVVRFLQEPAVVIGLPDLGVTGTCLADLIVRQRDFPPQGQGVIWKTWRHDRPLELPTALTANSFVAECSEDVYVGLAEEVAAQRKDLPVEVRRVTDRADIQRVADMLAGMGEGYPSLGPELIDRVEQTGTIVLAAEVQGEPVSAAWLEWIPGTEFAGLWGAGTVPQWQNKGIHGSLIVQRAEIAFASDRGVKYLYAETHSDGSRRNLRRMGFTFITTTTPYVWRPSA